MQEKKIVFYKSPTFIFLSLIPVILIVFRYIIGFNGLYGQDAHEYLRYSKAILSFFKTNTPPGEFHWETMYPALAAVLSFVLSGSFSLQLISIFSFVGSLFFIYKIISLIYGNKKETITYVLIFALFSSYFLRLGVAAMSDMLCIFFMIASIYYILKVEKGLGSNNLTLALVFACAAVLTRLPVGIVLFVPIFRSVIINFKMISFKVWLKSILICSLLYFSMYLLKQDQHGNIFSVFKEWSFKNYFSNSFANPGNGHEQYRFVNIVFVSLFFFHPGYLIISAFLMPFIRKVDLYNAKLFNLLLPIFIYLLFLAGFMHQNVRLNTLVLPLWIIFVFPAFLRFKEWLLKSYNLWIPALLIILTSQLVLFYFAFDRFVDQAKLEKKIAEWVSEKYIGVPIFTLGMEGAMQSYGNGRAVHSLGTGEVACGMKKLVLIETQKFELRWKNLRPLEEWYFYQQNCKVHKVMSFEQGWDLYECN